jgi:hypothetical protein
VLNDKLEFGDGIIERNLVSIFSRIKWLYIYAARAHCVFLAAFAISQETKVVTYRNLLCVWVLPFLSYCCNWNRKYCGIFFSSRDYFNAFS